jgi:hypothetical protein
MTSATGKDSGMLSAAVPEGAEGGEGGSGTEGASAEQGNDGPPAGDGTNLGIIVDELLGHQQVVVKSMEESYGAVPGVAGATILGNGRVALILDVEKLSELAVSQTSSFPSARTREPAAA